MGGTGHKVGFTLKLGYVEFQLERLQKMSHQRVENLLTYSDPENYMLSMNIGHNVETTVKPKWYKFWQKPTVTNRIEWVRHNVCIGKSEADMLLADTGDFSKYDQPMWRLLFHCLGAGSKAYVSNLQIERLNFPIEYAPSEYVMTSNGDSYD